MKHLVTPRLLMRPFNPGDLADFHELCHDPEIVNKISTVDHSTMARSQSTLERMIRDFNENGYGMFALIERKEKRFIGQCGLQLDEESGLIELFIVLLPSVWGKGYATEASMEVLRYAFGDLGIEQIIAQATEGDRHSTHVFEKIGMAYALRYQLSGRPVVRYKISRPQKAAGSLFQSTYSYRSKLSMPAL